MRKILTLFCTALCPFVTLGLASMDVQAQTYCQPSSWQDNSYEWITKVTFAGINNATGAGATAYSNFTSTVNSGQVTIGTPYTLSVRIAPDENEYIHAFIDWNQNGFFYDPGEWYTAAYGVNGTGPYTVSITPPTTALSGNTRMRIILDKDDMNAGDPCLIETEIQQGGYGETEDYTINVQQAGPPPVNSVSVTTQGNIPAAINTNAGTLQMTATVLPANAHQTVFWSIVPGTGSATVSTIGGLVTAQTNGTVWVKAISAVDISKKDSLEILISNQGTGVNDLFTSGAVAVYPNPVNNELYIDFKSWTAEVFTISMTNLLGQEVYKATLNNKKTAHNITNLAPGTYILNITDAKGNRSGIKINKQ